MSILHYDSKEIEYQSIMQNYIYIWIFIIAFTNIKGQNIPILHHPHIQIEKMDVLNSTQRETNLALTDDGNTMFFMSTRGGQAWSNIDKTYRGKPVYDGDIWVSKKDSLGKWQIPTCLGTQINTKSGEDEPTLLVNDKLFLYQSWNENWQKKGGPYYLQERIDDFEEANKSLRAYCKGLGGEITPFIIETQFLATDGVAMSPDMNRFLIVCGKDYDKDMDVYVSLRYKNTWLYPKKLSISTPKNERSISFAKDGKTIYFASNGYGGLGGLDIFKAEIDEKGVVTQIQNIGEPFNTVQDDYGFVVNAAGDEAYFIRDEDIYFAALSQADSAIKPKIKLEVRSDSAIMVKIQGNITEESSGKSQAQASVFLIDDETQEVVQETYTDAAGKYSFVVPNKEKSYTVKVDMYLFPAEYKALKVQNLPIPHSYDIPFSLKE